jgi:hypothetical protein
MYFGNPARMEPSCIWVFLTFFVIHSVAVPIGEAIPIGNVTTTTYGKKPGLEVTFASGPRGRGTIEILITCTATFFFCIWTAVHANILSGASSRQRFYNKFVLMISSIMLPEGVLVLAFGELRDALLIQREWSQCAEGCGLEKKGEGEADLRKTDHLSLQVAFFVVMGGFVIDDELEEKDGKSGILIQR